MDVVRWDTVSLRNRLNLAQRVVIVVALAGAAFLVGVYVTANGHPARTGWFAYAPETGVEFPGLDIMSPGASLVVWLSLTFAWLAASIWLLASPRREG